MILSNAFTHESCKRGGSIWCKPNNNNRKKHIEKWASNWSVSQCLSWTQGENWCIFPSLQSYYRPGLWPSHSWAMVKGIMIAHNGNDILLLAVGGLYPALPDPFFNLGSNHLYWCIWCTGMSLSWLVRLKLWVMQLNMERLIWSCYTDASFI